MMKFEDEFVKALKKDVSYDHLKLIRQWGFTDPSFSTPVRHGQAAKASEAKTLAIKIEGLFEKYLIDGNLTGIRLLMMAPFAPDGFIDSLCKNKLQSTGEMIGMEQVQSFALVAAVYVQVGDTAHVEAHIIKVLEKNQLDLEGHQTLMEFVTSQPSLFKDFPYQYVTKSSLLSLLNTLLERKPSITLTNDLIKFSQQNFSNPIECNAASAFISKHCIKHLDAFFEIQPVRLAVATGGFREKLSSLYQFLTALHEAKDITAAKAIASHATDINQMTAGTRLLKALTTLNKSGIDFKAALIQFVTDKAEQLSEQSDLRGGAKKLLNWTMGTKHTTKAEKFSTLLETLQGSTEALYESFVRSELSGNLESSEPKTVLDALVKIMLKDEPTTNLFKDIQHAFKQKRSGASSSTIADFEQYLEEQLSSQSHASTALN